jgi:RNA polymerase sigma factor (sigma-70 family)
MTHNEQPQPRPTQAQFATTRWSVVLAAGDQAGSHCAEALQTLCQTYWYPLYAYARQHGHQAQDAEDLTQAFLVKLIERNLAQVADRARGRFRSFLLTSFKHFISDQRDRARTRKRGGQARVFSLDFAAAETRYQREPGHDTTADAIFERRWALTALDTVFTRLRERYVADGKSELFDQLKPCLTQAGSAIPYAEMAEQLCQSEGALRVAVHRLRQRYRDLLRAEIAHTVADPSHIEDEIRHLFQVLAR